MKQITEDYVSFEIAKLLKEKGFDVPCDSYYIYFESNVTLYKGHLPEFSDSNINHNKYDDRISRPSQSLALKWLREVHNIYIDILTYTTGKNIQFRWVGYEKGRLFSQEEGKTIYFDSYEQAVEAALLYVLKNLI